MARLLAAFIAFILPVSAFSANVEVPKAEIPSLNVALPVVSAHPVVDLINQLQAKGVALPEMALTHADAAKLKQAAEALPQGSVRQNLLKLAQAARATGSGGAPQVTNLAELSRLFENSAKGGWLSFLGRKADRAIVYPEAANPEQFAVALAKLRWVPAAETLPESTRQIPPAPKKIIGQDRALNSIYYGLKMPGDNHNLYVSGAEGSGRETALLEIANKLAAQMPTPSDRVSVTNVADRSEPVILTLPAGQGPKLEAALEKFVKAYQTALPKVLNSGKVVEARKRIHEQVDSAALAAQERFDAAASEIRLPGGKFGVSFEVEKDAWYVALTYAKDGKFEALTPEQSQQLVASGAVSQEELDKARKDASAVGKKLSDQYQEMKAAAAEIKAKADEAIGAINLQAASQLALQLRGVLIKEVAKNRHDTPEHKAYEERAEKRLSDFGAEAARPVLGGQYGFIFSTDGQRIGLQLAKLVDGQITPVESADFTAEQIKTAAAQLIERYKAILKQNEEEHAAVHAGDEPLTEDEKKALTWVSAISQHAASHYALFLPREDDGTLAAAMRPEPSELYRVTVRNTNEPGKGAPVVFDRHPSLEGAFGASEERARTLMTEKGPVSLPNPAGPQLKPGTIEKADGGIWIAYAMDVLKAPGVFSALMQFAREGQVEIVDGGLRGLSMGGDKHHVPAKAKVVLIGSPTIRMLLEEHDEDFARAFRATAEFESHLPISEQTISAYLQFFRNVITESKGELLEMSRDAISMILEFSARILRSNEKLTAQFGILNGLMKEATFWARETGRQEVRREDVEKALAVRSESAAVFQRQYQEMLFKGVEIIETQRDKVGQINGLAVLGDFGSPMRVTIVPSASERGFQVTYNDNEAGWTGEYFRKSAADVQGFLEGLFGQKKPLHVKLAVAFEQTPGLDGDSATSTMMYGTLSALSGVPIKQNFAVTGSADQFGNIQAIGGINEKIEGFFDLARHRGLTGDQGIVMPKANVADLMLRPDIVEAVRQGKFHIYAVNNVKEGLEILTGVSFEEIVTKAKKRLAAQDFGAAE